MSILFSLGLGRRKVLVLRFGPKVTLKLLSTPPTTTTLNFLTSSRHSRVLKLGIQLNQTKPNTNLKKKNISQNLSKKSQKKISKVSKKILKNVLKNLSFKLNTKSSRLVSEYFTDHRAYVLISTLVVLVLINMLTFLRIL